MTKTTGHSSPTEFSAESRMILFRISSSLSFSFSSLMKFGNRLSEAFVMLELFLDGTEHHIHDLIHRNKEQRSPNELRNLSLVRDLILFVIFSTKSTTCLKSSGLNNSCTSRVMESKSGSEHPILFSICGANSHIVVKKHILT